MPELSLTPQQLATAFTEALVGHDGAAIVLESGEFRLNDSSRVPALTMRRGDSSITIAEDGALLVSEEQTHRLAAAVEDAGWPAVAGDIRDGVPLETVVSRVRDTLDEEQVDALLHILATNEKMQVQLASTDHECLDIVIAAALAGVSEKERRLHSDETIAEGDRVRRAIERVKLEQSSRLTGIRRAGGVIVYPVSGGTFRYMPGAEDDDTNPTCWQAEVENGPNVVIHRTDGDLWHIGILTEDMAEIEHANDGTPWMHVTLNDGPIYDSAKLEPTESPEQVNARRRKALDTLIEYYSIENPHIEHGDYQSSPARFAAIATRGSSESGSADASVTTHATVEEACSALADEVLDSGRLPDGVYDLDTGERIELHISTPVVSLSEDQGMEVNPLADAPDVADNPGI